jgi:hypothetical protein
MNNFEVFNEFLVAEEFIKAATFALGCAKGCGSNRNHAMWLGYAVHAATQHSPELGEAVNIASGNGRWGNIEAASAALLA